VITGVAFCPHPPVLVPDVARGAAGELAEVRAAATTAIRRIARPDRPVVVLGRGDTTRPHEPTARGSLAPFGVPLAVPLGSEDPGPVELPLSLTIGAWLLREALGADSGAVGWSIGAEGGAAISVPDGATLLVMGDGSARRSASAPGYHDERAAGVDDAIAAALRTGDPAGLVLDPQLAADLLVAGAPAWAAAAALLAGGRWDAELLYADAPYGVGYFVAAWTARA
jgi:hypothetical protein